MDASQDRSGAFEGSGRPAEALEAYRRALQNEPDDLNTILMAAHCCLDTGNYEEALKHYFRVEYENREIQRC
jgi:tetratricopeptide (TPR) repeat protein